MIYEPSQTQYRTSKEARAKTRDWMKIRERQDEKNRRAERAFQQAMKHAALGGAV